MFKLTRRATLASLAALSMVATAAPSLADGHKMTFTLATSGSETDQRSVAMAEVFAPQNAIYFIILLLSIYDYYYMKFNGSIEEQ